MPLCLRWSHFLSYFLKFGIFSSSPHRSYKKVCYKEGLINSPKCHDHECSKRKDLEFNGILVNYPQFRSFQMFVNLLNCLLNDVSILKGEVILLTKLVHIKSKPHVAIAQTI